MRVVEALNEPKITVLPHQWETELFYLSNKKGYNLSDCGSGKTLPTVLAIKELFAAQVETRILVMCPIQVVEVTWMDHFAQFAPDVPLLNLSNNSNRRRLIQKHLANFKGVVFINPDGLSTVFHDIRYWGPKLLIIDELSGYFRNCRTNRWKAVSALKALVRPAVWAFTGTPLANRLMDFYGQCLLINPDRLPRDRRGRIVTYKAIRDMLMYQRFPNVWVPKPGALETVKSYMQPAVRYKRADVMKDIKTPILVKKSIPLTAEQKQLMAQLQAAGKANFGSSQIVGVELMALVTKICQIAMGVVYDSQGNEVDIDASPRLEALVSLFEEVECTPVIVAAPYVHTIKHVCEKLRLQGYRVDVIYGDIPPPKRASIIRAFQAGEYDFLVCHPKTLAHGVTLTRSSTVCWYGPYNDQEFVAQLNDRIFRYGQTGQPLIVEFSSTPAEKKVYSSNRDKEKLSGNYLDLF